MSQQDFAHSTGTFIHVTGCQISVPYHSANRRLQFSVRNEQHFLEKCKNGVFILWNTKPTNIHLKPT